MGRNQNTTEVAPGQLLDVDSDFLIADDERPTWLLLRQRWIDEYPTDSPVALDMIVRTAYADWELRLEQRRLRRVETFVSEQQNDIALRTKEQNNQLVFQKRERRSAEQRLQSLRSAIEQKRRSDLQHRVIQQQVGSGKKPHAVSADAREAHRADSDADTGCNAKEETSLTPFSQSIHVEVRDGVTHTIFNPESEFLQKMLTRLGSPGQKIHRTLHLPDPLPFEYAWAGVGEERSPTCIRWILTQDRFEEEMIRERETAGGHVLPDPDQYTREIILIA